MCILLVPGMTVFILLGKVPHIVTIKSFGREKNKTNKQTNKEKKTEGREREIDMEGSPWMTLKGEPGWQIWPEHRGQPIERGKSQKALVMWMTSFRGNLY